MCTIGLSSARCLWSNQYNKLNFKCDVGLRSNGVLCVYIVKILISLNSKLVSLAALQLNSDCKSL